MIENYIRDYDGLAEFMAVCLDYTFGEDHEKLEEAVVEGYYHVLVFN